MAGPEEADQAHQGRQGGGAHPVQRGFTGVSPLVGHHQAPGGQTVGYRHRARVPGVHRAVRGARAGLFLHQAAPEPIVRHARRGIFVPAPGGDDGGAGGRRVRHSGSGDQEGHGEEVEVIKPIDLSTTIYLITY